MAQVGTATIKVDADTRDMEKKLRRLQRQINRLGRPTYPEAICYASTLAFIAFVVEKVL